MKFKSVPLAKAAGNILGHNITGSDGRRLLRKGHALQKKDLDALRDLGRSTVYVAELEPGDVDENAAALRIANAAGGAHVAVSKARTGRANLHAELLGLLRVDVDRLNEVNLGEAITLATLENNAVVRPGQMVATLKIIAYAVPERQVREAEFICGRTTANSDKGLVPLLHIDPLLQRSVSLILSGSPAAADRITGGFARSLRPRLESWGSVLDQIDFVPLEEEADQERLAEVMQAHIEAGRDMIILAGETAIMDRHDIAPSAVELIGGRVTAFGAPVDPGNLLMLALHDNSGRTVHIVGAPGCARSPRKNIVDLVLPRLLAGDYLTKMDIIKLGHGGMLEDVAERGRPRRLT